MKRLVNYFSGQVSHKKSTLVVFLLVFLRQLFSDNCLNPFYDILLDVLEPVLALIPIRTVCISFSSSAPSFSCCQHPTSVPFLVLSAFVSATRFFFWCVCVGTYGAVDWPRVGSQQNSRRVLALEVVGLHVKAVTRQQLSGHQHEGFVHILTILENCKKALYNKYHQL